jgi:hypothetical protein
MRNKIEQKLINFANNNQTLVLCLASALAIAVVFMCAFIILINLP